MKSILILVLIFLLTGCNMQGSISLTITPDPIEFTFAELEKDIEFEVRTEGFGEIWINEINIVVDDPDKEDETLYSDSITVDKNIDFSVPGFSYTKTYTINLNDFYEGEITETIYNNNLEGRETTLKVTITGSKVTTTEVPIIFN